MDGIKIVLDRKRYIKPNKNQRPVNQSYELAKEFGEYCEIPVLVVLRFFRLYGQEIVLSIKSWLYDVPFDSARGGKIALATWKLKELKKAQVSTTKNKDVPNRNLEGDK